MVPYYYSYPYYNRKSTVMPAAQPMEAPITQPPLPMQPLAPMFPATQVQPVTPVIPATPYMPTLPQQCPFMSGLGNLGSIPYMGQMENMNGMDMSMDNMGTDYADIEDADLLQTAPSISDPPPVLSNNPAVTTITLFKELTGYPNYGNPSGNADILYTGNRGTWTFDIPAFLFVPGQLRIQLVIRAVLDDHANVPVSQYSATITVNGTVVHRGALPLEHGTPAGARFNNWRSLTFNITNPRRNNRIVITNTSTAGPNDWIGLDWMEMRLVPR